ncbi:1-hydroxycarotenoid 3,4-desaturase CrtD [Limibacter armeniacum]|uniref:1-hydroxycarotenoid 3,4-desaturase CrtD n=1 Tax=Limibacter armeniacum TaxID=466084 RepID=UPI002FE5F4B8
MRKAGVIGAGIAGIASAIRLAVKGYDVTVFEKNDYLGGKLTSFTQDGYRFDAGPSLFTLPEQVEALFKLAGQPTDEYFSYNRLPVITNYFFEDGTNIKAYAEKERFAQEVAEKNGESIQDVLHHLAKSAKLYEITEDVFLKKSLHKLSTYLNLNTVKSMFRLPELNVFTSMHDANKSQFKHDRTIQLFNRYATYNGSNPYEAPATLNIIPHLEFNLGAYLPKGGMHSITTSLVQLAEKLGVTFLKNAEVERIIQSNGKIKGIQANGHQYPFDIVVSNMDIVGTYRKLLPDNKPPEKLLSQPKSSSALIFYWGIKQTFPELDVHNIFFSKDYKAEFEHIFKHKLVCDDPTVYINITSKMEKADAPQGCENWFVMINVPNNENQDWDKIISTARENIKKKLSNILGSEIESLIETEAILDPRSIEARTSSSQGALYGNSSNNRFAAFLRHANYASKIKGLYFCGGSVHPGGGIPLCLLSAKIVGDMVPPASI